MTGGSGTQEQYQIDPVNVSSQKTPIQLGQAQRFAYGFYLQAGIYHGILFAGKKAKFIGGTRMTNQDILFFFDGNLTALPLYEALEEKILAEIRDVNIKVQKTQIAFSNRHNFAFVSFLPVRKAKERPKKYITVTFGLSYRKESPRIDVATEPYPNRWTHHILISSLEEIDRELLDWLKEASDFSAAKR